MSFENDSAAEFGKDAALDEKGGFLTHRILPTEIIGLPNEASPFFWRPEICSKRPRDCSEFNEDRSPGRCSQVTDLSFPPTANVIVNRKNRMARLLKKRNLGLRGAGCANCPC